VEHAHTFAHQEYPWQAQSWPQDKLPKKPNLKVAWLFFHAKQNFFFLFRILRSQIISYFSTKTK
jgi:hypothetical protein